MILNIHKVKDWPHEISGDEVVEIYRGTIYGNPFSHLPHTNAAFKVETREGAISCYEIWIRSPVQITGVRKPTREEVKSLHGKHLACWCAPLPCHGHVLMRLAEEWVREDDGRAEACEEEVRRDVGPGEDR